MKSDVLLSGRRRECRGNGQSGASAARDRYLCQRPLLCIYTSSSQARNRRESDICERVRATVDLFRSLPEHSIQALNALTWPLCLAEGEDCAFLMALVGRASAEEAGATHRMSMVIAILKECWRLADSGEVVDADETSAMSSFGHEVILL